jgi:serpin B
MDFPLVIPGLALCLPLLVPLPAPAAAPGEDFAAALFARWCDGTANVVFSPHSIFAALAMTAAGARGESAAQIARALRPDEPPEQLAGSFALLEERLAAARDASPGLTLAIANSLWPQRGFAIRPAFAELIRARFRGEVAPLDYAGQTEEARLAINRWVAQRTADRIQDLIPPGALDKDTRLALVNAVFFLGLWETPFDEALTTEAPFSGPDGVVAPAFFMQRKGEMRHAAGEGVQALELPYAGGRFAMVVLLPDKDRSLREAVVRRRDKGLATWDDNLRQRQVALFLPRFSCTWMSECRPALAAAGITDIFDPARADLSGIAGGPGDLFVSAVIHKAFVEVTEKGTEAAAATGVAMRLTAFDPPVVFRADRPFAFLIRERRTGCVLFAGVVARP